MSRCSELQFFSSYPEKCLPYSLPVVCWRQNQRPWLCTAVTLKVNRGRFLLLRLFVFTSCCGLHLLLHTTRLSGSPGWPVISVGRDWGPGNAANSRSAWPKERTPGQLGVGRGVVKKRVSLCLERKRLSGLQKVTYLRSPCSS